VTGSPTLDGDRLFVPVSSLEETAASQPGYECCTFRGSVAALDTASGEIRWKTYMVAEAKPVGKNAAGTTLLARRSRRLVVAHRGPQARRDLRGDRQHVRRDGIGTDERLAHRTRPEDRRDQVDPAVHDGDVFGCRGGSVNCLEKSGPTSISGRRRCW
jgi:polyvinyl alcohol dehydrogenase (cytochrome)